MERPWTRANPLKGLVFCRVRALPPLGASNPQSLIVTRSGEFSKEGRSAKALATVLHLLPPLDVNASLGAPVFL